MNIGIRFHDAEKMPFDKRAEHIRQQGFGCAHLALYHAFADFPGSPALTPGFSMHIKRVFAQNGLDLAILGCYMNLLHPDAGVLSGITETYRAHLRFARWLGCGMVGTETGCPNAEYRPDPACRLEACFEQFIKNIAPVVADAERFGVVLGIEPVHSHSIYDAKRARRMLDVLQSPNVRIIFDPINLLNAENALRHREIFAEFIDLLGDEIAALHLKDFILDESGFRSVAFGLGQADFSTIAAFTAAKKPYIHATLEDTTPENAARALENAVRLFGG